MSKDKQVATQEQQNITTDLVIPEFNTLAFFSEIEAEDSIAKKVKVLNRVLNQESAFVKNMNNVLKSKGQSTSKSTDYDYIPIEIIEEALRQVFFRQVDITIRQSYRDLNSFIVVCRIAYKDPVTHEKRKLDGIGAKQLMQDANSSLNDFNATMKRNALELGVGIAYSRAVKNAAKKLGKLFGADLNRDEELDTVHVFNSNVLSTPEEKLKELTELFNSVDQTKMSPDDVINIERIISEKETASYKKAITLIKKYG